MLSISNLSGRLQVHSIGQAERDENSPTSRMQVLSVRKGGGNPRVDLAVGDFDGDGKADIAICDSETARIQLYRQAEADGLDQASSTLLAGHHDPARRRHQRRRQDRMLSLSDKENAIGQSGFVGGRLSFPKLIPTRDEPVAMENLGKGPQMRIMYIARRADPKGSSDKYFVRALAPSPKTASTTWQSSTFEWAMTSSRLTFPPSGGFAHGRRRLRRPARSAGVRAVRGADPALADGKGSFAVAAKSSQSALGTVTSAAVFAGLLDGKKSALLWDKAISRAACSSTPTAAGKLRDQYNMSQAAASVTGVTAIDIDGDGSLELAMYDALRNRSCF